MRMIETNDVLAAPASLPLYADQVLGIDVVTVVRRIGARVSGRATEVTVRTPSSSICPSSTPQHS